MEFNGILILDSQPRIISQRGSLNPAEQLRAGIWKLLLALEPFNEPTRKVAGELVNDGGNFVGEIWMLAMIDQARRVGIRPPCLDVHTNEGSPFGRETEPARQINVGRWRSVEEKTTADHVRLLSKRGQFIRQSISHRLAVKLVVSTKLVSQSCDFRFRSAV